MNTGYNPEFNPTGIEGGIDTNALPWIDLPQAPGVSIKPLRASSESGMFSTVVRIAGGSELSSIVYLGAMDMIVLSGRLTYPSGPMSGTLEPGTWGYVPANARVDRFIAEEDTEFLANFYGPLAFLGEDGRTVSSLLTSLDIQAAARDRASPWYPIPWRSACRNGRPPTKAPSSRWPSPARTRRRWS